jgi:hypothetical protein
MNGMGTEKRGPTNRRAVMVFGPRHGQEYVVTSRVMHFPQFESKIGLRPWGDLLAESERVKPLVYIDTGGYDRQGRAVFVFDGPESTAEAFFRGGPHNGGIGPVPTRAATILMTGTVYRRTDEKAEGGIPVYVADKTAIRAVEFSSIPCPKCKKIGLALLAGRHDSATCVDCGVVYPEPGYGFWSHELEYGLPPGLEMETGQSEWKAHAVKPAAAPETKEETWLDRAKREPML